MPRPNSPSSELKPPTTPPNPNSRTPTRKSLQTNRLLLRKTGAAKQIAGLENRKKRTRPAGKRIANKVPKRADRRPECDLGLVQGKVLQLRRANQPQKQPERAAQTGPWEVRARVFGCHRRTGAQLQTRSCWLRHYRAENGGRAAAQRQHQTALAAEVDQGVRVVRQLHWGQWQCGQVGTSLWDNEGRRAAAVGSSRGLPNGQPLQTSARQRSESRTHHHSAVQSEPHLAGAGEEAADAD